MAQAPVQLTPPELSLLEARELVTQRYLSPPLAEKRVVEWLNDKNKPVRWRYEHIQNNSGVSTETALNGFWRPAGLSINWGESWAARKIEPRTVTTASGGMAPAGIVRWVSNGRPTQPSSQLGSSYNFFVYGIRLAGEDIELRLGKYGKPASVADPAPPPVAEPLMSPQAWFGEVLQNHPRQQGETKMAYARRLYELMKNAPLTGKWQEKTLRRRLDD